VGFLSISPIFSWTTNAPVCYTGFSIIFKLRPPRRQARSVFGALVQRNNHVTRTQYITNGLSGCWPLGETSIFFPFFCQLFLAIALRRNACWTGWTTVKLGGDLRGRRSGTPPVASSEVAAATLPLHIYGYKWARLAPGMALSAWLSFRPYIARLRYSSKPRWYFGPREPRIICW